MIHQAFNNRLRDLMKQLNTVWPAIEPGEQWLKSLIDAKGEDTNELTRAFVEDFKEFTAEMKKRDFLFMRTEKIPILEKLHFSDLLQDEKILKQDFDGLAMHVFNNWTLAKLIVVSNCDKKEFDRILRRSQKAFLVSGLDPKNPCDLGNITNFAKNVVQDKTIKDDILDLSSNFKMSNASNLCKEIGIDRDRLKNFSKTLTKITGTEDEMETKDLDNMVNTMLNPSDDVKDKSLPELMDGSEEDMREALGKAFELIQSDDGGLIQKNISNMMMSQTQQNKKKKKITTKRNSLESMGQYLLKNESFVQELSRSLMKKSK